MMWGRNKHWHFVVH